MKTKHLALIALLAASPAVADEEKPFYPLSCSVSDLNHPERSLPEVKVALTDRDIPHWGDDVTSKRFELPGFPGYFLEVSTHIAPVYATDQSVDLRLRTKDQLSSLDAKIAWAAGHQSVALAVTLPGDTQTSLNIVCLPDYFAE